MQVVTEWKLRLLFVESFSSKINDGEISFPVICANTDSWRNEDRGDEDEEKE